MRLKLTVLAAAVVALAALAVIPAATGARTAHATKVVLHGKSSKKIAGKQRGHRGYQFGPPANPHFQRGEQNLGQPSTELIANRTLFASLGVD